MTTELLLISAKAFVEGLLRK